MKNIKGILLSVMVIGIAVTLLGTGTFSYFSDTETAVGNTFTAGTVDIALSDKLGTWKNPWTGNFQMDDMKPCYTDLITFIIYNKYSDPNPVNVWKYLENFKTSTGAKDYPEDDPNTPQDERVCSSEPEYAAEGMSYVFDPVTQMWGWTGTHTPIDNIDTVINYDMRVDVYDKDNILIWWQTIYNEEKTLAQLKDQPLYLGMIPAFGYMIVTQSYHMQPTAGNEYQGDQLTFDIRVYAEQLEGTAWLENKQGADPWLIIHGDGIDGTLTYKVKNPTFDFTFTGIAPLTNHLYYLVAGGTPSGGSWDPNTLLGSATSDGAGAITISGNLNLNKDMKNAKVWLVPTENWDAVNNKVTWGGYPGCVANFLWETGLIWYEDTSP